MFGGRHGAEIFGTPEAPAARVMSLRRSFDEMTWDRSFIADVSKRGFDLNLADGEIRRKTVRHLDVAASSVNMQLRSMPVAAD